MALKRVFFPLQPFDNFMSPLKNVFSSLAFFGENVGIWNFKQQTSLRGIYEAGVFFSFLVGLANRWTMPTEACDRILGDRGYRVEEQQSLIGFDQQNRAFLNLLIGSGEMVCSFRLFQSTRIEGEKASTFGCSRTNCFYQ